MILAFTNKEKVTSMGLSIAAQHVTVVMVSLGFYVIPALKKETNSSPVSTTVSRECSACDVNSNWRV